MDLGRLEAAIEKAAPENVPFVRMEATTNLIGGQPFSLANLREVKAIVEPLGIPLVIDGSLISENAYFIRQREPGYENTSIAEIIREMMSLGRHLLPLRPQELQRARRLHRHQPQGLVRRDSPVAAGLRGLLHLRRHVVARKSKRWRWASAR